MKNTLLLILAAIAVTGCKTQCQRDYEALARHSFDNACTVVEQSMDIRDLKEEIQALKNQK